MAVKFCFDIFEQVSNESLEYMKSEVKIEINYPITSCPVVCDFNSDGINELVVVADKIYIFDLLRFKLIEKFNLPAPCASTPAIFSTDKNGKFLVVGSDDDNLYFFPLDGKSEPFSFKTEGDVFSSPLIKDVDNDGFEEVIFGSDDFKVYTLKLNEDGRILNSTYFMTEGFVASSPALFPNRDGTYDIVIGSWDENLYRIDARGRLKWKTKLSNIIWSSPVVCDINGDGRYEVVAVSDFVFIIDENGEQICSHQLGSFTVSSPALCDIDDDGFAEIVVLADGIYLFKAGLELKPGFPVKVGSPFWSSPIVVDINGDGLQEIIACDYSGNIWIVNLRENEVLQRRKISKFPIVSTPIAYDIDNDGFIEIVICTMGGEIWILPTSGKTSKWNQFRGRNSDGLLYEKFKNVNLVVGKASTHFFQKDNFIEIKEAKIRKVKYGRVGFFELVLRVNENLLRRGTLYFVKRGQLFPSPLFGDGETFIGRFPPYKRFSLVKWFVKLEDKCGNFIRFPKRGFKFFVAF